MVPAGDKAKRLSSVNHTTKIIHHHHHHHFFVTTLTTSFHQTILIYFSDLLVVKYVNLFLRLKIYVACDDLHILKNKP